MGSPIYFGISLPNILAEQMMPASRQQLREQCRADRGTLSAQARAQMASQVAQHFFTTPAYQTCQTLACYMAIHSELDTRPIIEHAWQAHKRVYLPVLSDSQSLVFARFEPDTPLQANRYGIAEPHNASEHLLPAQLDLVCCPLVAFTRAGDRLGTGAGYYDRSFAFLRQNPRPSTPQLIGLAYACQEAPHIEREKWDVLLNSVVTHEQVFHCLRV